MSTEPVQNILPRNYDQKEPEVAKVLEKFSAGLDEVVNYGTHIFTWCNDASVGKSDEIVPLILSFRHCLELLDATSILIKKFSVEPCKLHLRAIFESLLTVQYILKKDQIRRAFAFLVCHVHKKTKLYKKLDFETEQGKQLKIKLKGTNLEDLDLSKNFDLSRLVSQQEKLLNKDGYSEAELEYQRLRRKGNKNPNWYELYDGPSNIEQLSQKLLKTEYYELLYRQWSEYVHATDIISGKMGSSNGQVFLNSIRQPFEAQSVTSISISFAKELYELMIKYFVPDKELYYRIWWEDNLRNFHLKISDRKRIIIPEK